MRGHTIANLLRCLGSLAPGHPSSYHRIFSRDRWSSWTLARCFAQKVLARFVPEGPIELAGDDTVEEHPGKNVYGKGCHRDPVRSTHSFTAYRWGHKWVALTVLVRVPFATRRWALPLLMTLYLPEEENRRQGRRHKTPSELMQQMLAVLIHWFPDRQFIFTGDGGYGTHALASFAHRHCRHLSLVSLFYPDANLCDPPPVVLGKRPSHRPRKKGAKLPAPQAVVAATAQRKKLNVSWYGGGRRNVEVVSRTGQWYKSGAALIPILWVFVHDLTGTHRDTYLFTTVDRLAVHRAECCGDRVGRAGGAVALERPVGEDAWRGCDQGHRIALAGGTPRGLDRSRECAAEREGIRARAGEHREGPTFRRRRVGKADGERAEVGAHHSSGGPATQAEE